MAPRLILCFNNLNSFIFPLFKPFRLRSIRKNSNLWYSLSWIHSFSAYSWFVKCETSFFVAHCSSYPGGSFHLNKFEMHYITAITGSCRTCLLTVCVEPCSYSINLCMICHHGRLIFVRYNLTATWLKEVCHNVLKEPPLQPIFSKVVTPAIYCLQMWWCMPELIYMQKALGVDG